MSHRNAYTTNDYNVVTKGRLPEVHRFENLADMARKRGEADMVLANTNIRKEYTKRLKQTREMKDHMERIQRDLRTEMAHCEHARNEVLSGLRDFEPILLLSKRWSDIRRGRPTSPSSHYESISRATTQYNDEVKLYMEKLVSALRDLETSLTEMRDIDRFLDNDINAKVSTMIIDNACMEELISPQDLMGPGSNLPIHNAIMQSSKLHTEKEWANNATAVLSSTNSHIIQSQKHRKKAIGLCRSLRESGKYNRSPAVLDAFAGRIKYNKHHCMSLEANMLMVNGQIDALDRQKAMMVGSLEKVLQQLGNARQRLNVRALLPDKENTRPDVEVTLEIEMSNLRQSELQLRDKLTELEKKREKQIRLLKQMNDEVQMRSDAIRSDTQCAELKLTSSSSQGGVASTPSKGDESCRSSGRSRRSDAAESATPKLPAIGASSAPHRLPVGGESAQLAQPHLDDASGRSSCRSYSSSRSSQPLSSPRKKPVADGKRRLDEALAAVAAAGPPIQASPRIPKPPTHKAR